MSRYAIHLAEDAHQVLLTPLSKYILSPCIAPHSIQRNTLTEISKEPCTM